MKKKKYPMRWLVFFLGMAIVFFALLGEKSSVFAQEITGPQDIRWIRVGSLHNWFSSAGAEVEYGRRGRAQFQAQDQADQLYWEAQYPEQDRCCSKGLWIGCKDYDDPVTGERYPFKVVCSGPCFSNTLVNTIPVVFKMIGKFPHPIVSVDGLDATENTLNDQVDEYDPDLPCDRMIYHVFHTNMGVTVTRKIYGFSQQNHDNYFIYDYVFKNTGIIDSKGTKVEKTLTGFYVYFQYRYAPGWEGAIRGWNTGQGVTWGRNTINDVDYANRIQFSYYGPHSQSPGYEEDWGSPNYTRGGPLGAPAFVGIKTLHADKSASDHSDDPSQPTTTKFIDSDNNTRNVIDPYNKDMMTTQYALMSAGHAPKTHAEEVGTGFADLYTAPGTNPPGGYHQAQGFGPYTLAPGDSIRIVIAEAVAGLKREKSMEVGDNWFYNRSPFILPDGNVTTDRNAYKKAWVWTAKDSLYQALNKAYQNFQNGLRIPQPPPPPDKFIVSSGGDRIRLEWEGTAAESWPYFDGYQIYRAVSRPDTFYQLIFSCDKENVVHQFDDITAQRGFDYYYYIVTKDDGSQNDAQPGVPLVSSKFYTMTNQAAHLRRPAVITTLDSIRVVPNPFHIGARSLQFDQPDRIAFFGLPPVCTIKIYTEKGDLIDTIEHTNNSGDELWDSVTSSRQVVVSGLYIAVFETPDGKKTYRKFVIVR